MHSRIHHIGTGCRPALKRAVASLRRCNELFPDKRMLLQLPANIPQVSTSQPLPPMHHVHHSRRCKQHARLGDGGSTTLLKLNSACRVFGKEAAADVTSKLLSQQRTAVCAVQHGLVNAAMQPSIELVDVPAGSSTRNAHQPDMHGHTEAVVSASGPTPPAQHVGMLAHVSWQSAVSSSRLAVVVATDARQNAVPAAAATQWPGSVPGRVAATRTRVCWGGLGRATQTAATSLLHQADYGLPTGLTRATGRRSSNRLKCHALHPGDDSTEPSYKRFGFPNYSTDAVLQQLQQFQKEGQAVARHSPASSTDAVLQQLQRLDQELQTARSDLWEAYSDLKSSGTNAFFRLAAKTRCEDLEAVMQDLDDRRNALQAAMTAQDLTSLAAALASVDYRGSRSEGLGAREVYAPRDGLVQDLLMLVRVKKMALLFGPPRCGKTSTLQLVFWRALELVQSGLVYSRVEYFKATDCQSNQSWDDFVYTSLRQKDPTSTTTWSDLTQPPTSRLPVLILIDELSVLYNRDVSLYGSLWAAIKSVQQSSSSSGSTCSSTNINIVATAMHDDSPSLNPVPGFELPSDQKVSLYPTASMQLVLLLSEVECSQLFDRTWERHPLCSTLFKGSNTKDSIFHLTNGYVGIFMSVLDLLEVEINQQSRATFFKPIPATCHTKDMCLGDMMFRLLFLNGTMYDTLRSTRSFLNLGNLHNGASRLCELLLPVIKSSNIPASVEQLTPDQVTLLRDLEKQGMLRVLNDNGVDKYCLHSPLHMYYYQYHLARYKPSSMVVKEPQFLPHKQP